MLKKLNLLILNRETNNLSKSDEDRFAHDTAARVFRHLYIVRDVSRGAIPLITMYAKDQDQLIKKLSMHAKLTEFITTDYVKQIREYNASLKKMQDISRTLNAQLKTYLVGDDDGMDMDEEHSLCLELIGDEKTLSKIVHGFSSMPELRDLSGDINPDAKLSDVLILILKRSPEIRKGLIKRMISDNDAIGLSVDEVDLKDVEM